MKLLISIGILLFSISSSIAGPPLSASDLIPPEFPDILKKAQAPPAILKKLLDDDRKEEFFKQAAKELDRLREFSTNEELPNEELRKHIPWIFYFIANAPLFTIDSAEQARCAVNNRDADLYLKEEALAMLAISAYRDLFPKGKTSRELMASCGAAIMRSFLNGTKSKSYTGQPVYVSDEGIRKALMKKNVSIMDAFFAETDKIQKSETKEEQSKKLNQLLENASKRIRDNAQQFQDQTVIANTKTSRNRLLKNMIKRSEEHFIALLTDLFPREKSKIRKYIKMAGYKEQEIRPLIQRTAKRDE